MKRVWLALGGSLGLSALWRRRRQTRHDDDFDGSGDDPAAELRAKLAESRAGATDTEETVAPPAHAPAGADDEEPMAQPEAASPLDPEVRRRSLYERTRASMEELGSDTD